MILSDRDIKKSLEEGKLVIDPLPEEKQIQAAWIDLKLGNEFRIFRTNEVSSIDTRNFSDHTQKIVVPDGGPFTVHPHELVIGCTKEYIGIPSDHVAYVDGRSSLGRLGIIVHTTASWIDPGFSGRLSLEITNLGRVPVIIYPGMRICKLVVMKLSSECEVPYSKRADAKYLDQRGPIASRMFKDFTQ